MTVQAEPESLSFEAEAVQILDLVVHSLYSDKEIFLRELISNASDAIDRLRLELLARSDTPEGEGPLQIRVSIDAGAGTITVADNGIGMSRQEVIEHIGTIAKSGTRDFLQALSGDQRKDASLIGQFGVGFYSAFIVADHVTLTTCRVGLAAEDGVRWASDGRGTYTLENVDRPDRGTTIVLHLRDGEDDLLNTYRLRSIIEKYSDHISVPIMMPAETAAGHLLDDDLLDDEQPDDEQPDEQAREQPVPDVRVNQASAFWARPKTELTDQDYAEFYRHITNDYGEPIAYLHSKIEGNYEYTLLLFIPPRAPFDLWASQPNHGVRLHVQRVFIMEDNEQLMPRYLRFIRGVIDANDLPLNVSRELLQGSRAVEVIRINAVKRVLKLLRELAESQPAKYAAFWREFGTVLKEGMSEDYVNRDDIAGLLRFTSTASADGESDVSLSDYVSRMKQGQEKIYYVLAPSAATARNSPHLEAFREKGIEVLLLGDYVDDWVVSSLPEFDGKRLQSVTQGAPDFGGLENEAEKDASEKASTEFADLVRRLKEALGDKVWDVRVTSRLTSSPACIVASEQESGAFPGYRMQDSGLPRQPVLEINPQHLLVKRLRRDEGDPRLADWANVLYNQAVLTLGGRIDDPAAFVGQLNNLLVALSQAEDQAGPPGTPQEEGDGEPAEEPAAKPRKRRQPTAKRAVSKSAGSAGYSSDIS
jgi:molecular chaperone HtpG